MKILKIYLFFKTSQLTKKFALLVFQSWINYLNYIIIVTKKIRAKDTTNEINFFNQKIT